MKKRPFNFEWTFSSRVRERKCVNCSTLTPAFLTLASGVRKPLYLTCFLSQLKPSGVAAPTARKQPTSAPPCEARSEQLRLC